MTLPVQRVFFYSKNSLKIFEIISRNIVEKRFLRYNFLEVRNESRRGLEIKDFYFKLGFFLILLSVGGFSFVLMLAKFIQYKEFELWGTAFTNSNDYLWESPLIYIEFFLALMGFTGLFFIFKRYFLKRERN